MKNLLTISTLIFTVGFLSVFCSVPSARSADGKGSILTSSWINGALTASNSRAPRVFDVTTVIDVDVRLAWNDNSRFK